MYSRIAGQYGNHVALEAEAHFDELAEDVACATRFIAGNYADVLPALHDEGLEADTLYMDLVVVPVVTLSADRRGASGLMRRARCRGGAAARGNRARRSGP